MGEYISNGHMFLAHMRATLSLTRLYLLLLFCRAQLTQAVLLPPHAHVLELLPWIPDYIRGKWVQTKHMPTPLGVIFLNTDLK